MTISSKVAGALSKYGRNMVLRRRVGTTNAFTDVPLHGVTRGYDPQEIVGSVVAGDREVTISNSEISAANWPGPPRRGDLLVVDGTTTVVQSCDTNWLGTEILSHTLQVRG